MRFRHMFWKAIRDEILSFLVACSFTVSIGLIFNFIAYPIIGRCFKFIKEKDLNGVFYSGLKILAIFLLLQCIQFLNAHILARSFGRLNIKIKGLILEKFQRTELSSFDEALAQKTITSSMDEITAIGQNLFFLLLPMTMGLVFLFISIYHVSRKLSLLFGFWCGSFFAVLYFSTIMLRKSNAQLFDSQASTNSFALDVFKNVFLSKVFELQERNNDKFREHLKKETLFYENIVSQVGVQRFVIGMWNICFFVAFIYFLTYYCSGLLAEEIIIVFATRALDLVNNLWNVLNLFLPLLNSFSRLTTAIKQVDALKEENEGGILLAPTHSITVRNLNFSYEGKEVLKNLNFHLEKEFLYIKGSSGAGKSTLIKILNGFINVPRGHIFIGNVDINDIHKPFLRKKFTFLTQHNLIMDDTLQENIGLGNLNSTRKEVQNVMEVVNLGDMPDNNSCGIGGTRLSGGQCKRVCFARMILHFQEGNIVFLDEPFENLDSANVEKLLRFINSLRGKSIVICVDHSGNFEKIADKVVDLQAYVPDISYFARDFS